MYQQTVEYDADGLSMRGELLVSDDNAGPRPGILVFPEGFGLAEPAILRARMLAELGYAALACDLHGDARLITDRAEMMELLTPLRENPLRARARGQGALAAMEKLAQVDATRIAAIGYCIGGTIALELARSGARIAGVVGFHSGLATAAPQDAANITGKILVCLGADDPGIDASQRSAFEQEMRTGGANWQMNLYGGAVHAFTNADAAQFGRPEALRYDAQADNRSWAAMKAFLEEIFGLDGAGPG